jgi:hypothetical protein
MIDYCLNNPVNNSDISYNFSIKVVFKEVVYYLKDKSIETVISEVCETAGPIFI